MTDVASINALAAALQKMAASPYTPATTSQGVITAISFATTPPTVSITLSGSSTVIPGVQYASSYYPTVGDTVQVLKQGNSLHVMSQLEQTANIGPVAPAGLSTATVTAISFTSTPPTLTMTMGGVSYPGVSYAQSYFPTVGDTVNVLNKPTGLYVSGNLASVANIGPVYPAGISTGTVSAVNLGASPPTLTLSMGGTTFNNVRFSDSYLPRVGDTVNVLKQGTTMHVVNSLQTAANIDQFPAVAPGFVGPGVGTNLGISGGANRTAGQTPFIYADSQVVTLASGKYTVTTSGTTFHGCGYFSVTPGSDASALGFLTVLSASTLISGGNLTINGFAQDYNGVNISTASLVRVNIIAVGW